MLLTTRREISSKPLTKKQSYDAVISEIHPTRFDNDSDDNYIIHKQRTNVKEECLMFCHKCGGPLVNGALFCSYCGAGTPREIIQKLR
ncbi:hypothetical protein DPMN_193511 [Dreissena polymorpha]|uniref:Zinc-ribbon domain-containing protein n=1 Tax=Dreissena polymorpha TaxID=45954 RepID=A0A9D3Y0C1_DREPO|nr:hypothetical protein DPMN_193511 [Dreissena polymorpha]